MSKRTLKPRTTLPKKGRKRAADGDLIVILGGMPASDLKALLSLATANYATWDEKDMLAVGITPDGSQHRFANFFKRNKLVVHPNGHACIKGPHSIISGLLTAASLQWSDKYMVDYRIPKTLSMPVMRQWAILEMYRKHQDSLRRDEFPMNSYEPKGRMTNLRDETPQSIRKRLVRIRRVLCDKRERAALFEAMKTMTPKERQRAAYEAVIKTLRGGLEQAG